MAGSTTINGGTGTPAVSIGNSGTGSQSIPSCSGPNPSSRPTRGSPSATVTANTDVIPDGYGISST
ncbi:hypothetical protein [Actinoplanes couchii]|uniref:Uncharacterized protein n=1 Tax=Actinoplanes couchii TaxID=403638 RepID=A0ABQ3XK00_9ACTN|nr:hypothetical protein [Actinoplanes couchii]MDR6324315.1 hypothetical protein [Actinoplanes couchii]GID58825.1 hypothetical protein Aco03nite_072290 [Actinoplanes couchii]